MLARHRSLVRWAPEDKIAVSVLMTDPRNQPSPAVACVTDLSFAARGPQGMRLQDRVEVPDARVCAVADEQARAGSQPGRTDLGLSNEQATLCCLHVSRPEAEAGPSGRQRTRGIGRGEGQGDYWAGPTKCSSMWGAQL